MFSRLASMISICLFFHSLQADMLISVMLMKNKHVHAIKAVRRSLHASCCAYKLF